MIIKYKIERDFFYRPFIKLRGKNETDINVNGDNREEKLIGNRDILYFFILIYSHFHQ